MAHPYKDSAHRNDPKWIKPYADGGEVSNLTRKTGRIRLRDAMGGDPAAFGPINRSLYGAKLNNPRDVEGSKREQMNSAQDISDAVPRRRQD